MRSVYDRFAIDPEEIQLVEAHGTGTKLGDPIEVEGLNHAFRHYTQKQRYCSLGSVKSNIGHCTFAAGVASVLKLVLALKHEKLPPAANFERLNEHIDLADSPFVIDTQLKPWPAGAKGRRLAAVSSFGFSGTNAHLVLEASPQRAGTRPDDSPAQPLMIPLSAKTREQLQEKARDLADFIVKNDALSLIDVAYTLQVGREAMSERCATVVRTKQELAERLRAVAAGQVPRNVYVGSTSARASKLAFIQQDSDLQAALIEKCIRDGKFDRLMELWADGLDLSWDEFQRPGRRIELPLYPFAKERYWLAEDQAPAALAADGATSVIHPLPHVNASTLARQRYRTMFRGDEFFLRDHRVRIADGLIANVLPGVAYLEMAAAAVADALPERAASQAVGIDNVTWSRPLIVNEPTTVAVEVGVEKDGTITFEVVSESGDQRVLHCQGEAEFFDAAETPRADVEAFSAALEGEGWRAEDIYSAFPHLGLHYGPAHRGIEKLCRVDGTVLARISLPAVAASDNASYRLHPSVMDAALQAHIGFLPSLQTMPRAPSVPFSLQSLRIHAPCPSEVYVVLTPTRPAGNGAAVNTCDVAVYALDGRLCVAMAGFISRVLDTDKAATPDAAPIFDEAFYQELLANLASQEVLVEEAIALE
jgi:acyl transferase domain-containing protein